MKLYLTLLTITVCSFAVSLPYKAIAEPPLGIINGTTADDGEFPYMVEIRIHSGFYVCGGGILSPERIITAGHCVDGGSLTSIVYGTNKLYSTRDGYPNTSITIKNMVLHPKFTTIDDHIPIYDVGLIQLSEPIVLSEKAQPLKLAESGQEVPFYTEGVLTGWGVTGMSGGASPYLLKIYLQLLNDTECISKVESYDGKDTFRPEHHLCSDDHFNGECSGDSGSPFAINGTTFGLVSWSFKPCGSVPGTYSRLSNPEYRDWIKNVTGI